MSLTLPINRRVTVSERRNYTLTYSFCDFTNVPASGSQILAKALPRFQGFLSDVGFWQETTSSPYATYASRRTFGTGDMLWRQTGTRSGKESQFSATRDYNVYTKVVTAVDLPVSIGGGLLSVTIPFGATFTRRLLDNNAMDLEDTFIGNDPMNYYYYISVAGSQYAGGSLAVGVGSIVVEIDLGQPAPVTPVTPPTVCSVEIA
jgi:hypothetical protein